MVELKGRKVDHVPLNLKNEEAERLARELAQRTGETLTTAVIVALRERIERENTGRKRRNRMQWLHEITKQTSLIMNDARSSKELFDELHDPQTGLPK